MVNDSVTGWKWKENFPCSFRAPQGGAKINKNYENQLFGSANVLE